MKKKTNIDWINTYNRNTKIMKFVEIVALLIFFFL